MPPALSSTVSRAHPACHLSDNNKFGQMTMKRIHREIGDLKKEDLGAIVLVPTEENLYLWKGSIPGPEGSVYDGGVFNVEVVLPPDYPCVHGFFLCMKGGRVNDFFRFTAPKVMFKTRYASYLLIARYKLTPHPQDIPHECPLVSLGFTVFQRLMIESRFLNRGIYALTF